MTSSFKGKHEYSLNKSTAGLYEVDLDGITEVNIGGTYQIDVLVGDRVVISRNSNSFDINY